MNLAPHTIGFSAALLVLIGVAFAGSEARIALGMTAFIASLFLFLWTAGKRTLHPERGAVTVTYKFPVSGTVAPTAAPVAHRPHPASAHRGDARHAHPGARHGARRPQSRGPGQARSASFPRTRRGV